MMRGLSQLLREAMSEAPKYYSGNNKGYHDKDMNAFWAKQSALQRPQKERPAPEPEPESDFDAQKYPKLAALERDGRAQAVERGGELVLSAGMGRQHFDNPDQAEEFVTQNPDYKQWPFARFFK